MSIEDQAEQLINERKFVDAIALLDQRREQDTDGRLTLLLASAYAGDAGINLIDSYSFFAGFLLEKPSSPSRDARKIPDDGGADKLLALAQLLQLYLMTVASDSHLFFTIPRLTRDNRSKLVEAMLQVESIDQSKETYIRGRQYLVFLNLIQFGNYFKDLFPNVDFSKDLTAVDLICGLEPNSFVLNFEQALASFMAALKALDEVQAEKPIRTKSEIESLKSITTSMQKNFANRQLTYSDAATILSGLQQGYCR